ncbi:MAG: hypothetical protein AAF152_19455 [Cyanobacteria bacterium P01_A01_bin.114]
MTITHVNRKQQTYYLHQGKTKTGKPRYFFSMKTEGDLVDTIPDGFEIYENPNAQVFLRKIQPQLITDDEIAIIKKGIKKFSKTQNFLIDVKKNIISIFTSNQNASALSELLTGTAALYSRTPKDVQQLLTRSLTYSSDLRFILVDKQKRLFQTERFCYLGSIDDWIEIGPIDQLSTLVKTYVRHLGQESFYDLR